MYKLLCREATERGLKARSVTVRSLVEALRWQHAMTLGVEVAGIQHAGTMGPMITTASGNAVIAYRDGKQDYVHCPSRRPLLRLALVENEIKWRQSFGSEYAGLEDIDEFAFSDRDDKLDNAREES